jgi:ribosomal-protein-serine acetyltransferase
MTLNDDRTEQKGSAAMDHLSVTEAAGRPIDPVLVDVPMRLETPRLVLRPPRAGDGEALNEAVRESLPELRPWMPWAQHAPSLAESEAYCRRQQARFILREDLPMLIFERAFGGANGRTGALLGATGLHRIDWALRRFEIGYWARRGHAGQGYISEAVRRLTRMAFEELGAERVEVRMDERNEASQRVAEAAGFEFEAVLRQESVAVDGLPRDTRVYARVRERAGPRAEGAGSARRASAEADDELGVQ